MDYKQVVFKEDEYRVLVLIDHSGCWGVAFLQMEASLPEPGCIAPADGWYTIEAFNFSLPPLRMPWNRTMERAVKNAVKQARRRAAIARIEGTRVRQASNQLHQIITQLQAKETV